MDALNVSAFKRTPSTPSSQGYVTGGSFHLIARAQYLGRIPFTTKSGAVRNFYYLALLFCRRNKAGEPKSRVRILTMSGKPDSEFNRFLLAVEGQTIDLDVDSDKLGPVLADRINGSSINVNVVFESQGPVPVIKAISRLQATIISREPWMVWPAYIITKFPQLADGGTNTTPNGVEEGQGGPIASKDPVIDQGDVKSVIKKRKEKFATDTELKLSSLEPKQN